MIEMMREGSNNENNSDTYILCILISGIQGPTIYNKFADVRPAMAAASTSAALIHCYLKNMRSMGTKVSQMLLGC